MPGVVDVICTVQSPVVPTVLQVFTAPTKPPGPLTFDAVTSVFAGAFVEPVPSLTFTWTVNVWFVPIGFAAVAGVIWMLASTQVLDAFALSPARPSPVARVND